MGVVASNGLKQILFMMWDCAHPSYMYYCSLHVLLQPETVEHWLKCPATVMKRQQHFGRGNVDLDILSRDPERSLAFAKATLL